MRNAGMQECRNEECRKLLVGEGRKLFPHFLLSLFAQILPSLFGLNLVVKASEIEQGGL